MYGIYGHHSKELSFANKLHGSRDGPVGIATSYGLDGRRVRVRVLVGARYVSTLCGPVLFWGSHSLLFNGYWGLFPVGKAAGE
jgi:hypothetical protein